MDDLPAKGETFLGQYIQYTMVHVIYSLRINYIDFSSFFITQLQLYSLDTLGFFNKFFVIFSGRRKTGIHSPSVFFNVRQPLAPTISFRAGVNISPACFFQCPESFRTHDIILARAGNRKLAPSPSLFMDPQQFAPRPRCADLRTWA